MEVGVGVAIPVEVGVAVTVGVGEVTPKVNDKEQLLTLGVAVAVISAAFGILEGTFGATEVCLRS